MNEELEKNYEKALEQKYNAVCFDIDGTLTEDNSSKIDYRILPLLANILKRNIPIVFITGRGETGLNDMLNDIVYDLKNKYNVTDKQLLKMFALTNDGARIFMTSNNSKQLFNVNKYISSNDDLAKMKKLNEIIINLLNSTALDEYCKITYSLNSVTNDILNIRIKILTDNKEINNEIVKMINTLLTESNNLNLTTGIYNGNQILQIGTATKDKAIKIAERIIGIPENSMLRIGDCGDENGNDYSMLDCPQGFSVDRTSGKKDRCFPVIKNREIISGVDGTIHLLKKAKLLPTICLEHAVQYEYARKYAMIEQKINQDKKDRLYYFNNQINNKFFTTGGIDSIFDKSSGSIKIPMYEWINIPDDNLLKQLWLSNNNSNLYYSMFDNESLLLRGSGIYYYFLAQRTHDENTKKDITSKDMIYEWLDNNTEFFNRSLNSINGVSNINDINNTKMILGILDNIRNTLLIMLNQKIMNLDAEKNIIMNLETINNDSLIHKLYSNLISVAKLMGNISFKENYQITNAETSSIIKNTILLIDYFRNEFNNLPTKDNYSKDFRAYREIDNFAENYIACNLTLQNDDYHSDKGFCGLCYGGLELPIIMKSLDPKISDISVLKFNNNVTGYAKKQSVELRFFDIFKSGGIEVFGIDKEKEYMILDDNLLTGKTMQLAITTFYDLGIDVNKIMVVRYPGINRISQMFMPNHGAVDYKQFFNFIEGLLFPSPYSWRDSYSTDPYEDSLGTFDLNRRKILECLVKNGDFSNKSEVVYVRRMVKNEKERGITYAKKI
ncbi:MAG: hypothetical protein Q4G04_02690 [bacterium]|nr:hypothetical protein [bacterium]